MKTTSIILLAIISVALFLIIMRSCQSDSGPIQSHEKQTILRAVAELKGRPAIIQLNAEKAKQHHLTLPIKERIAKVKNAAPGIEITDTSFTAGVELADTITTLKIDLQAAIQTVSVMNTIVSLQDSVIRIDSNIIVDLQQQNAKAEKRLKAKTTLTWFLAGVGVVSIALLLVN